MAETGSKATCNRRESAAGFEHGFSGDEVAELKRADESQKKKILRYAELIIGLKSLPQTGFDEAKYDRDDMELSQQLDVLWRDNQISLYKLNPQQTDLFKRFYRGCPAKSLYVS